jgi:hypothetical protein
MYNVRSVASVTFVDPVSREETSCRCHHVFGWKLWRDRDPGPSVCGQPLYDIASSSDGSDLDCT